MSSYSPAAMKRIERQQREAEMLRQLGLTSPTGAGMVGPHYVVGNAAGNIAQQIAGAYMLNKANREVDEQNAAMEQEAKDWITQALNKPRIGYESMFPKALGNAGPVAPATPAPATPTPAAAPGPWDQIAAAAQQQDTTDNQRIAEGALSQADQMREMFRTGKSPVAVPPAPAPASAPAPEAQPVSLLNKTLGLPSIVQPDREVRNAMNQADTELAARFAARGEKGPPMAIDVYGGQPPRNPATLEDMAPGMSPPLGVPPEEQSAGLQQSPMAGGQQSIAPTLDKDAAAMGMQKDDYLQWLLRGMQNPQTAESAKALLAGYIAEGRGQNMTTDMKNFMFRRSLPPDQQQVFDAMGGGKDDMAITRYNKLISLATDPNNPFPKEGMNDAQLAFLSGYRPFMQVDTGTNKNIVAPGPNAQTVGSFKVEPKPEQMPAFQGDVAKQKALGTAEAAIPKQMKTDYRAADAALTETANFLETLSDVAGSDLNSITGPIAGTETAQRLHAGNSSGAMALSRLNNLKSMTATIGRKMATLDGKLGNMAVQEWKIVAESIANMDTTKGERALREQLAVAEARVRAFLDNITRAYALNYGDGAFPLDTLDERMGQIKGMRQQSSAFPKTLGGKQ